MLSARVYRQPGGSHGKYAFVCVFVLCVFCLQDSTFPVVFKFCLRSFKYVNFFHQPLITLNLMGNMPER